MTTGERIRAERLRLGLSPEVCAEALGISLGRWEELEASTNPQCVQLVALSDNLGMDLRVLLGPEFMAAWERAGRPTK